MKLSARPVHYAAYQRAVRAGWSTRLCAYFLDVLAVTLIQLLLVFLLHPEFHGDINGSVTAISRDNDPLAGVVYLCVCVLYLFLPMLRDGEHNGQTPGKQVMGIRIIRDDGLRVNLGTYILREIIGKFLSAFACLLGYLWPLWDKSNRAWHDILSGTHVLVVDRQGLPKFDHNNSVLPVEPDAQTQAPIQRTLGMLQAEESAYLQADILSVDNARGCWLNPNAMVGNHSDHWYCMAATATGAGFTLYITQDLVAKMEVSQTASEEFHAGGWLPVTAFEVVDSLPSLPVQAYTQLQEIVTTEATPIPPGFSEMPYKKNRAIGLVLVAVLGTVLAGIVFSIPSISQQIQKGSTSSSQGQSVAVVKQNLTVIYKASKAASVSPGNDAGNYPVGDDLVQQVSKSEPQLSGNITAAKHPAKTGEYAIGETQGRNFVGEAISDDGVITLTVTDEAGVVFSDESDTPFE